MKSDKNKLFKFFFTFLILILIVFLVIISFKLSNIIKNTKSISTNQYERFDNIKKDLEELKKDVQGMNSKQVSNKRKKTLIKNIDEVINATNDENTKNFYFKINNIASEMAYNDEVYMNKEKSTKYSEKFSYMLDSYLITGYISSKEFENLSKKYQQAVSMVTINSYLSHMY